MESPNIFKYATSELSQDAVICYFAEWANPTYKEHPMHKVGQLFVQKMLDKWDVTNTIDKVEVYRQYKNIDVLLVINEKYAMIIEDKTYSSEHSNQLNKYKESVQTDKNFKDYEIKGIYFKKSNQSYIKNVTDSRFKPFFRDDIISFIESCPKNITDTIFTNFRDSIEEYQKNIDSWETLPVAEWTWNSWEGFYEYLSSKFENKFHYGYVANQSGGFLGASWAWTDWEDCVVQLQIEGNKKGDKFVFKIRAKDNTKDIDMRFYRNRWHSLLIENAEKMGINGVKKPARFGYGTYMTCCIIEQEDWLGNDTDVINIDEVLARLEQYKELIIECSKQK